MSYKHEKHRASNSVFDLFKIWMSVLLKVWAIRCAPVEYEKVPSGAGRAPFPGAAVCGTDPRRLRGGEKDWRSKPEASLEKVSKAFPSARKPG